jgi:hypothetical protein
LVAAIEERIDHEKEKERKLKQAQKTARGKRRRR